MFEKLDTPAFLAELRGDTLTIRPFSFWRTLLVFLVVFIIGSFLQGIVLSVVLTALVMRDNALWQTLLEGTNATDPSVMAQKMAELLSTPAAVTVTLFASAIAALCAFVYCRKFEKRSYLSMGIRKKRLVRSLAVGSLCGCLLLAVSFLFAYLFNGITVTGAASFQPFLVVLLFFGIAVQALSEEIFFRGYLLPSLASGMPLSRAVLIVAFVYAFLQPSGEAISYLGFVNSFLFGLLLSLCMVRTGSIFAGAALCTFLRAGLGLIFGSPVFGVVLPEKILSLTFSEGGALIHGGAFGMEGGIAVSLALTLGVALLGMKKTRTD